jgi:hypothetical protein
MHGCPKWSLSFSFPHQSLYTPLLFPIRATCSAYLILEKLVPVITACRILRFRMEERPPILRITLNILNKQSRRADKE